MNNDKELNRKLLIRLRDLIIVIVLIILMVKCSDKKTSKTTSKSDIYISAYVYSQDLVRQQLKSPKSASFPLYNKSFIIDKGDTILISAYVDADNSFGANVRVNYTATINLKNDEPVGGFATLIE
jgi:hypothetical protein